MDFEKQGNLSNSMGQCGLPRKLGSNEEEQILQMVKAIPSTNIRIIATHIRNKEGGDNLIESLLSNYCTRTTCTVKILFPQDFEGKSVFC